MAKDKETEVEATTTGAVTNRRAKQVVIVLPPVHAPKFLQGFVDFLREQGVIGVAIGLVFGIAAKSLVDSFVANIVNPIVGLLWGGGSSLENKAVCIQRTGLTCTNSLKYGHFISDVISFLIIAFVVYFVFKLLKLEKLTKKKS